MQLKILKRKMYNLRHHYRKEGIAYRWTSAGERFLDIGAGGEALCESMKEKYKEVYRCDISDEKVKNLKNKGINAFKIDLNKRVLPENFPLKSLAHIF